MERPNFEKRLGICYNRTLDLDQNDQFLIQFLELIKYRGVICDQKDKKWILFYTSENLLYQSYEEEQFLLTNAQIPPFILKLDQIDKTNEEWQFNLTQVSKRLLQHFANLNLDSNSPFDYKTISDFINTFFFKNKRLSVGEFLCLYYEYEDKTEMDLENLSLI